MARVNNSRAGDKLAIQEVLTEHSRGLDRADAGLLEGCYWPDATVDYGAYKGPAQAFVPLVVQALSDGYALTRHVLGNTCYRFAGERCFSETLVIAQHLLPGRDGEILYNGRYLDVLRREGDEWRLQHRQVVSEWVREIGFQNLEDSPQFADLTRARHDDEDPSYSLFGQVGESL